MQETTLEVVLGGDKTRRGSRAPSLLPVSQHGLITWQCLPYQQPSRPLYFSMASN